jgi:hypothetical protein
VVKRFTAAALPFRSSVLRVLTCIVFALAPVALLQAGVVGPADLKGGITMLYTMFSEVLTGYISSYAAGLALLP